VRFDDTTRIGLNHLEHSDSNMDTLESDPYRPFCIEDMKGAAEWNHLKHILTTKSHIILAGPAGTGKSRALRYILGSSIVLWLRCNQDPSLRDSRDTIKNAARKRVAEGQTSWIILEHADSLHTDAQAFLRRIIETSTGASRFVLEVRDVSAIAEPIFSRTVLVNGPILSYDEIRAEIIRRSPTTSSERVDTLAQQSNGNLRWAILQALGGEEGMVAPVMAQMEIRGWADILTAMDTMQSTGSAPRAWIQDCPVTQWDRPGGACPWALSAWTMSKSIA
jgi:hypothetical protein